MIPGVVLQKMPLFLQVLVPLYVSEIAPVHLRGGLGVFNQLAVTSGIFLGQVSSQEKKRMEIFIHHQILGLSDALGNTRGWPWLLAITCLPPLLQLVILAVGTIFEIISILL